MDSSFQILRFLRIETKLLNDLNIVLWECSFEDLVDMLLFCTSSILDFGVETFFNYIARKLQLGKSDKIFSDLHKDLLILVLILKLQNVLDKVIAIWVFD